MNLRSLFAVFLCTVTSCSPKQEAASSPDSLSAPVAQGASFADADTVREGSVSVGVKRLRDNRLAEVLALGSFREPGRSPSGKEPPVYVRLWGVPREGSCVDGTHWVCQHDYLLSVNFGDLGEAPPIYGLGRVGEVTDLQWTTDSVPWTLRLTVSNYPPKAHRNDSPWKLSSSTVDLAISYDSVWVRK